MTPRLKSLSKFRSFELLFCVSQILDDIKLSLVKGKELRINKSLSTLSDFNLSVDVISNMATFAFPFQHYNSHLESSSVGSPDTGAVYRALPVYRVSTEARLVRFVIAYSHSSRSHAS